MPDIDGDDGLAYQIYVLRRMSQQLPGCLAEQFCGQIDKVVTAIDKRNQIILGLVRDDLDDVRLEILSQQFDLESTKKENATLQQKLRNAGIE